MEADVAIVALAGAVRGLRLMARTIVDVIRYPQPTPKASVEAIVTRTVEETNNVRISSTL